MLRWQRIWLRAFALGVVAVWPARWAVQGFPDSWRTMEGGGAWPVHLVAELMVAALCLWAAGWQRTRVLRPAGLLALGTLLYGSINGLSYGVYGSPWHIGLVAAKLATAVVLSAVLIADAQPRAGARPWWPGLLVALIGAGMITFWSLQTATGIFKDGVMTVEGDGYLIFHQIAEETAAGLGILGGVGLLLRMRYTAGFTLVGAGAILYAAVNSFGWAVLNDAALGAIFIVSSVAMVAAAAALWRASAAESVGARRVA